MFSQIPVAVPERHEGQWIVWDQDDSKVIAVGATLDEAEDQAAQVRTNHLLRIHRVLPHGADIHRDLKPANIMVGAFGEVQVMDWGLAKVLAEGGIADEERAKREQQRPEDVTQIRTARSTGSGVGTDTEAGSLLGTPAYMPPEQANGDVALLNRRADVFGLGALLCEILTGKPPYVGRSYEEVRRKACNGDLADAFARLGACGADAELIALARGCLAAEAGDRPKDAQAVADGLAAYLNGVQERLRQAELAEAEARARAAEEAKRRRLTLALAGTVLLALALGGGGYLYVKSERDARQAQVAREVNDALNQATALREQAKAAPVGGAALFAQAREQVQRALALVESGPADDTLKTQVTRLQSELDEEEKDRRLVAALDEARLAQAESAAAGTRFAHERAVLGATEPAEGWTRQFRAARDEKDEARRKTALEKLAAADDVEKLPVRALTQLAGQLRKLEAYASAARLLRRAQQQYPADFWVNLDLGDALTKVTPPEWDEAVRFLTAAVALRPESPGAHVSLGVALERKGQEDEAIASFKKAIALDPKLADAHYNLGLALADKGQLDEAIACFQKVIALDPKNSMAYLKLAALQAWLGQDKELAATRKKILAFASGTHEWWVADRAAKACSIRAATDQADLAAALALGRTGVQLHRNGWTLLALGMAEYRSGNDAAAQEALSDAAKADPNNPAVTGIAAFYRALSLFRQGKRDEARKLALAAAAQMKPLPKDQQNPLADNASHDDLILWLAYKEAKALLKFDAP
jgi:serine/threonine-protein kinase